MTLLTVVMVAVYASAALLGFTLFERAFGIEGALIGAALGLVFAMCVQAALTYALGEWGRRSPPRPKCRSGRCNSDGYRLVSTVEGGSVWACLCGGRYLSYRRRFFELLDEGNLKPFMRWRGQPVGWELDSLEDVHAPRNQRTA